MRGRAQEEIDRKSMEQLFYIQAKVVEDRLGWYTGTKIRNSTAVLVPLINDE